MSKLPEPDPRGGKRPGSRRKKLGKLQVTMHISKETAKFLKKQAKKKKTSVSEVIDDIIRSKTIDRNQLLKNKNIKGILIDPVNRTITEVQVDNENFLTSMYGLMRCDLLEVVRMSTKTKQSLWVDRVKNNRK
jgi:hypothetical protein